ncbi:oligosaccharide flippase family protein [Clostridium amazonitimonense]|uniref:oligosaccharide flippase family protein n=1 Tax=Clostridium amazonitimonense TaxID=1499689 RepID=UPI000509B68C|nr:oligosaccharide flippase family protein [Clostridium amazonitimonense]
MNSKLKDFTYTLSANILNFAIGIVTGFLLPKFLSIDDYAAIKVFTFYIGYVGFMHLGFIDGILLRYGSYDYNELPKKKFRAYFKFLLLFQVIIMAVMMGVISMTTIDPSRRTIFNFVAINMLIMNLTTFFCFIHQFTKEFKLFSFNLILTKLFYVIGCLLLFYVHNFAHGAYIILQTGVNLIILLIYIYFDKDLVFGKSESIRDNIKDIKENINIGFFVMIGNFMNIIIIGIDRLFIDNLFTKEDFAMYSFAYSIVSLFYIVLNSLNTVMYPYLTRTPKERLKDIYGDIKTSVSIIIGASLSGFFVIKFIVIRFLSNYVDSLGILIFLIPTVLLSAQISVLISNFYKVLKLTKEYTKNNIIAFSLGVITNTIAYFTFKSTLSIAAASLISFMIWVLYSDGFFMKKLRIKVYRSILLEVFIIALFLFTSYFMNWYIGLMTYLICFGVFVFVFYKKDVMSFITIIKPRK